MTRAEQEMMDEAHTKVDANAKELEYCQQGNHVLGDDTKQRAYLENARHIFQMGMLKQYLMSAKRRCYERIEALNIEILACEGLVTALTEQSQQYMEMGANSVGRSDDNPDHE